jgi:hypothetical protein
MIAEMDGNSGAGGRVWIFSCITGNNGNHRIDSVDMMTINGEGKIVKSKDVQRALEEEEEKPLEWIDGVSIMTGRWSRAVLREQRYTHVTVVLRDLNKCASVACLPPCAIWI